MDTTMFATINSETACAIDCTHKVYGPGKITNLRCSENQGKPEIFMAFESPVKSVILVYSIVVPRGILVFNETDAETLECLMAEYGANWLEYDNERKAEHAAKLKAKLDALEQAKKEKANEEKAKAFEKKKVKDIAEFEEKLDASKPISAAAEFYTCLGWLTKHAGTVSAALPDYLEPSFVRHFGDVPRRVVDSKKKGPAGWTSQWASSFAVSLKKPDCIPALLEQYLNPARKALTDTSFVWELVDNYGFKFGKTQSLEAIQSCVPATYLPDFEAGLAM